MSGICGIHEPGRELRAESLAPMLDALALPEESGSSVVGDYSAVLGVAQRWKFQQTASVSGVLVAADADLIDCGALLQTLNLPPDSNLDVAELLARLYLQF